MCNFSFVAKDFLTKTEMTTQESFSADSRVECGPGSRAGRADRRLHRPEPGAPSVWAPAAPRGGHSGTGSGLSARWLQKCWLGACRCALAGGFSPPAPREDSPAPVPVTGLWLLGGRVAWARTSRGAARGVGASCGACAWSAAGLRVWGWGGARPRLPHRGPLRQCGRVPPASRRGVLGAERSPGPARDATRAHVRRVSHSPPAPRAGRPQPRAAGPHVATERSRRLGPGLVPHRRARRPSGRSSGGAAGPRGASSAPSVRALLRGPSISDSVTPGGWGSFPGVCFPLDAKNSACHIT